MGRHQGADARAKKQENHTSCEPLEDILIQIINHYLQEILSRFEPRAYRFAQRILPTSMRASLNPLLDGVSKSYGEVKTPFMIALFFMVTSIG